MPKEHFKVSEITSIASLKTAAHIHLIGVCGVAMGQLAVALKRMGFVVSGSDKEFYEPMGSVLRNSGITLFEGYHQQNLAVKRPDLVVIGNAISYDNSEVEHVENQKLAYTCFPQALYECLISGKHSVVVAGTHGKSTTSGLIAHILQANGKNPAYFVGGVLGNSESSFQTSTGQISVVEGDEYDSAFFAKVPKFSFYQPNTFIINALEFDHADIYQDLAAIDREFANQIQKLGPQDLLVTYCDDPHLVKFISEARILCQHVTFGESPSADMHILKRTANKTGQLVDLSFEGHLFSVNLPIPGAYNARNLAAACIVALRAGLSFEQISSAAQTFKSVKRRFEIRLQNSKVTLIEDFAHHPTAIAETLKAARESFPDQRICAVFEPRSNTSRRAFFYDQYIKAFSAADQILICSVLPKDTENSVDLLDTGKLCNDLNNFGKSADSLADANEIYDRLLEIHRPGDVLVLMSNGSFGGIIQRLVTLFSNT